VARSRQLNAKPFGGLSNQISGIVVRVGYTPFPLILFNRYRNYVKTSEVAKLFGVHPNTVRLYEEWGYLPPIPRDSSGQRAFTEKHVEQMRLVRHTLHNAPRSGLQIKQSYKELVWLACAGHVQLAITQTHKHLAVVKLARERAQNAHDFLQGVVPENIAHLANRPLHIHQAASLIDESVPVLRRWESSGVILVPRNPKNNYRTYRTNEIGWLFVVQSLRFAGHTISSCRRLINQYHNEKSLQKSQSRSPQNLCEAIVECISLFIEHEKHTNEVFDHLHRMTALV
jgi:DNA-binding transcriptional MerR regulator